MGEHVRIGARPPDGRAGLLSEPIRARTRRTIDIAAQAEGGLGPPGVARYARCVGRCGYRNRIRAGKLTGPAEPMVSATTAIRATARAQEAKGFTIAPHRLSSSLR